MSDDPSTAAGNDGDGLAAGDLSAWLAGMQRALDGTAAADVPCGDCTGCCTSSQFVPVGPDEVDTLAHIPPELLFPAPRMPAGHVLMGYDEHGRCPMLVGGACSIYAHRPRTCRTYDCRVFPATGVELDDGPGGDDAGKAEIARRSRRWRFTHPGEHDRVEHEALRAATCASTPTGCPTAPRRSPPRSTRCWPCGSTAPSSAETNPNCLRSRAAFREIKDSPARPRPHPHMASAEPRLSNLGCISQQYGCERCRGMKLAHATVRRGGATSRLGGQPTVLPDVAAANVPEGQLALPMDVVETGERRWTELLPGVVHVPDWLDLDAQQGLVEDFRRWALPPAGLRHPRVPTGQLMSVQSVCLGWHWWPYTYSRTADDTDGAPVKPLPAEIIELARQAVGAAYGVDGPEMRSYAPDAGIVNLYAPGSRLGLHQDGEEPSAAPVVTISLGDACTFRMAGVDRRTGPFTDVDMRSGDLLVFGGPNRRIYHGVPRIRPGTAPAGLGLVPGRLSITVRETGLA
jgi:alkylated DNA repair protein (DNA oxidative demethylase)